MVTTLNKSLFVVLLLQGTLASPIEEGSWKASTPSLDWTTGNSISDTGDLATSATTSTTSAIAAVDVPVNAIDPRYYTNNEPIPLSRCERTIPIVHIVPWALLPTGQFMPLPAYPILAPEQNNNDADPQRSARQIQSLVNQNALVHQNTGGFGLPGFGRPDFGRPGFGGPGFGGFGRGGFGHGGLGHGGFGHGGFGGVGFGSRGFGRGGRPSGPTQVNIGFGRNAGSLGPIVGQAPIESDDQESNLLNDGVPTTSISTPTTSTTSTTTTISTPIVGADLADSKFEDRLIPSTETSMDKPQDIVGEERSSVYGPQLPHRCGYPSIAAPPCPRNYLLACQPHVRPVSCTHGIGY